MERKGAFTVIGFSTHIAPNVGQAFLPNGMTTVEHYSCGDQTTEEYEVQIWIPVTKKQVR